MAPFRSHARFGKARVVSPTRRRTRARLFLEQFEPRDVPSFVVNSYAAGSGAAAVAAADLQGIGDGAVDFAVANIGAGTVSVFLNNHDGSGTFRPAVNYPAGGSPVDIVAGDVDGDGFPDLVVSDSNTNTVSVLYNNPANPGTFSPRVGLFVTGGGAPRDVRLADLNGDGFPDVVVANSANNTVGVLLNLGDGNFGPARTYPASALTSGAYALAVADFFGDGFPSVAVSNPGGGTVTILRGNGDGTLQRFRQVAAPGLVTGLAAGDLGNGSVDLVSANNNTGGITVLLNDGAGNFTAHNYPAGMTPLRVELGDVNGDGALDVVTDNFLSTGPGNISIFYGNGDGTLRDAQNWNSGGDRPSAVAIADVEGDIATDGRNDIIVTNNVTGNASVLLNSPAPIVLSTTLTGEINHPVSEADVVFSDPIDLNTFVFDYDEFSLVDPNGRPVRVNSITATDDTNTRFHVTFTPQSTLGQYTVTIGPDIYDITDQYRLRSTFVGQFTITNNLIINGGFETGNFAPWTQSGDTGATAVLSTIPIHSGRFAAQFGPLGLGFIAQTVNTVPGQTYQLSLWLAHPFDSTGTEFQVMIGGTLVDDQTDVGNFGYTQFTYTYTATGTTTTIQLGFKEPPEYFYLDDVSFTPADTAARAGGSKGTLADASGIAAALRAAPGLAPAPVTRSGSSNADGPGRKQAGAAGEAEPGGAPNRRNGSDATAMAGVVRSHEALTVGVLTDLLPNELSQEAAVTLA